MICELKWKNFKCFGDEASMSFFALERIKRFDNNAIACGNKKILKTIGIYGPNNTGKTCLVTAIGALKNIMLGSNHENVSNAFNLTNNNTYFSITYLVNDRFYTYEVEYDAYNKRYLSENLKSISYAPSNPSVKTEESLIKRNGNRIFFGEGETKNVPGGLNITVNNAYPIMSIYEFDNNQKLRQAQNDYRFFAASLDPIFMDKGPNITKTLNLMQTNQKANKFIVKFIQNCDLNIEDFGYSQSLVTDVNINEQLNRFMQISGGLNDLLKIYSKHHGYRVPSIFFDSVGTLKILALAGYIYEAITRKRVVIIDELDNSLHHIISRALVSLFNNSLNTTAQLFFTTHDINLMDSKRLMRKDQIWLTDIDSTTKNSKLVHLSDFTAKEDGFRGDEDIAEYYLKGRFGSIPSPDLFEALQEATSTND